MAVIGVCVALVALGVAIVIRWGDPAPAHTGRPWTARRVGLDLAAGLAAGVLAAGAGGRLVMRLLAVTSPEVAGSVTEAGEIIGEISVDGTLGFIVFAGLPAGAVSGALYALLRPVLPAGRIGGLMLGAVLVVLAGPTIDPLRADNFDFVLVGPGWLSVLAFTALGLFQGLLVAAIAARLSEPVAAPPRLVTAGRIALGVVVLVALPVFVSAVADILRA